MTWNPLALFRAWRNRRRAIYTEYLGYSQRYRQEQAERERQACDICSGRSQYVCPYCRETIHLHTHENDFSCERHGFVDPIRLSDGARICGDGHIHPTYEVR